MASEKKDIQYVTDSRIPARRIKNVPKPYSEFPGKTEPFFPNFLLKEWMVGALFLIAFMILVLSHPAPLEKQADPNDTSYIPLPDWYFLFLYQFLKYFPGDWAVIGIVVIPAIAYLAFILAPWLDRGPERRPSKRPIATGIMLLVVAGMVFLTWQAVVQHEAQVKAKQQGAQQGGQGSQQQAAAGGGNEASKTQFDPAQAFAASCAGCHGQNLEGGFGPALTGLSLSPEEIVQIMTNGKGQMPPGVFRGSDEEKLALAKWILEHK